jgi:hypothetical protein
MEEVKEWLFCDYTIPIEGTARPGTCCTVYDPANVLGGQRYRKCDKPGKRIRFKFGNFVRCTKHENTLSK